MFELTKEEFSIWRTQFASSKSDSKGLRYPPFCFTEQGVTMLSCILNSDRAIAVNIQIIIVFTKLRQSITDVLNLKLEIEEIKSKISNHGKNIELVFKYLDKLIEENNPKKPRVKIGFKK